MTYVAPSANAVNFVGEPGGYSAPPSNAIEFKDSCCGLGAGAVVVQGNGEGVIGASGQAGIVLPVSVIGFVNVDPVGVGEARFSMDTLASGEGVVAEFGSGAAQLRFDKSAIGIVGPIGSASISLTPRVEAVGFGDAVRCIGAIVLPVTAAGEARTAESIAPIEGAGQASLSLVGQGEGRASICGVAQARLRVAGAGQANAGVTGQSALVLPISGAGTARRGAVGAGAAGLRLSALGRAGVGASGIGRGEAVITGIGGASTLAPVSGAGRITLPLVGRGVGERVIDYSDARVDLLFVRTAARNVFVQAA